jgi:hypothetical protein
MQSMTAPPPGVSGGGDVAPAPPPDLTTALTNLSQALTALTAVLQAYTGAAQVTAGGPGSNSVTQTNDPTQTAPPTQAPSPTPAPPVDPPPPPASSVRDKIVASARGELAKHVTEDAGTDEDSGGNIRRYRDAVTGPKWAKGRGPEAWCADFASWVWKDAGTPFGPKGTGEASTSSMIRQARDMGSWKTSDPKPGDMILFDWGRGKGTADAASIVDHVAIVDHVTNGIIHTIGGNQSDAITKGSYPLDDKHVLGYISPPGT